MSMTSRSAQRQLIPTERIEKRILLIRGQKVMLDVDLADLYRVSTGALNQAVKRNLKRFPKDFMFQLTSKEMDEILISQIVISSLGHGEEGTNPSLSPNKESRCCRRFSAVIVPFK